MASRSRTGSCLGLSARDSALLRALIGEIAARMGRRAPAVEEV
jgi:hypothetical protein